MDDYVFYANIGFQNAKKADNVLPDSYIPEGEYRVRLQSIENNVTQTNTRENPSHPYIIPHFVIVDGEYVGKEIKTNWTTYRHVVQETFNNIQKMFLVAGDELTRDDASTWDKIAETICERIIKRKITFDIKYVKKADDQRGYKSGILFNRAFVDLAIPEQKLVF